MNEKMPYSSVPLRPAHVGGVVLRQPARTQSVRLLGRPEPRPAGNNESPRFIGTHSLDPCMDATPGTGALGALEAQAKQQGYEAGFEQGLAEGRQHAKEALHAHIQNAQAENARTAAAEMDRLRRNGEQAAAAKADALHRQLKNLIDSVRPAVTSQIEAAEDDVVALCMDVLCRWLGAEAVSAERIAQLVKVARAEMSACNEIAIHLHPADLEILQTCPEVWTAFSAESTSIPAPGKPQVGLPATAIRWISDETIRLGGCILRGADGGLDARLETKLAILASTLSQVRADRFAGAVA